MNSVKRARVLVACCVVLAAAVAAGCGSNDDVDKRAGGDKVVKIAFLTNLYTDYVQAIEQGLNDGVKQNGGSVKVFNAAFDPQKMSQQCLDVIASGRYNAIVINPIDHPSMVPCVKAAAAAKLPVGNSEITIGTDPKRAYDIHPQVDGVVAAIIVSVQSSAAIQASLVKQACVGKDPCEVIAEIAAPSEPFTNDSVDIVEDQVPNVKIVARVATMVDPAAVTKAMPDLLSAHPGADVFLAVADSSALAALAAVKDARMEGKIVLIGGGGSRAGAKAVAAGTLFGSVGSFPRQAGRQMGESMVERSPTPLRISWRWILRSR
jgi:ribose transport system substrate-binding protein